MLCWCFVWIRSTTSLGVDGIICVMFVRSDNLLCVEGSCSKSRQTSKHLIVFTLRSTCFRVVVIRMGRQHASAELRRCVDVPSSPRDGLVKVFFLNGILDFLRSNFDWHFWYLYLLSARFEFTIGPYKYFRRRLNCIWR